jgi:hypothetical protein
MVKLFCDFIPFGFAGYGIKKSKCLYIPACLPAVAMAVSQNVGILLFKKFL